MTTTRKSEAQKYFRVSPQKDGGLREIEITKVAFNLLCSRSLDFAIVENKVMWPDEHDSLLSSEEKARVTTLFGNPLKRAIDSAVISCAA
jgi:hypothetical protein